MNISGHSIGGKKSCIVLDDYKVVLDIGVCPDEAIEHATVLVTHGHVDHLAGAVQHAAIRSLAGASVSVFVVPTAIADQLEGILKSWIALQGQFNFRIVPLDPGQEYVLASGIIVQPFKTDHVVASQGYALVRRVKKLKPEFFGQDIKALRAAGVDIHNVVETVEVAYTGDTRITAFDREPLIRTAKVLIHEATYVGDEVTMKQARHHGHTHLDEIAERADQIVNDAVVLCHLSSRHKDDACRAATAALPESLRGKVSWFL